MDNSKEFTAVFMLGFLVGGLVVSIGDNVFGTTLYSGNVAIEECEKALPRNQHCVITAVPKLKD